MSQSAKQLDELRNSELLSVVNKAQVLAKIIKMHNLQDIVVDAKRGINLEDYTQSLVDDTANLATKLTEILGK